MKITIDNKNYTKLPLLEKQIAEHKFEKLEVGYDLKAKLPWKKIISSLHRMLDYEFRAPIWLIDIPFCFMNACTHDHIVNTTSRREWDNDCAGCKYFNVCSGPPPELSRVERQELITPVKDLPQEVMIEIESKCNFNCSFCYNHNSFAKNGRQENNLYSEYVKKIIDHIASLGIGVVRFTGGEPLLRRDLYDLMSYSKEKGLEVRLNTNASLVTKEFALSLRGVLDNVLIPIESFLPQEEARITAFPSSLPQKIKAIQYFYDVGIPTIRVGTVASKKNIEYLKDFSSLILDLPIEVWEFYRPISGKKGVTAFFDQQDVFNLVQNIIALRNKTNKKVIIANSLPFCSIPSPYLLAFISTGALFDEGHSRLVVDPRGFVKPHYFIDRNIGNPLDLEKAWNNGFMRQMRELEFLPSSCSDCLYRRKCRGGSRFEAEKHGGDKTCLDPLADISNKIK
jgi:radical SAM protein with 4Fe4S-binding SPASM domain